MPEQFTSYVSFDVQDSRAQALAATVVSRLSALNHSVLEPSAGTIYDQESLQSTLSLCSHFLVIATGATLAASSVACEIEAARTQEKADGQLKLIVLVDEDAQNIDRVTSFLRVDYSGSQADSLKRLEEALSLPASVPPQYRSLTDHFVGRENVFTAVNEFMQANKSGIFTLVGDPGEGKSTICAELALRTGCLAYFNSQAEASNDARRCVQSIADQVQRRYDHLELPPAASYEASADSWYSLFQSALSSEVRGRVLVTIDALDEVSHHGGMRDRNILALPANLPNGIFLILSRRRVRTSLVNRAAQRTFDLVDHRDASRHDVKDYITRAISRLALQAWIHSQSLSEDEFIAGLVEKSQLNFMYLHYVLPEISSGAYSDISMDQLPDGLRAYYESHWRRMGMAESPLPKAKIRIIYALAVMRRPVTRTLLADVLEEDPVAVQGVIDEWEQFFHKKGGGSGESQYSIYHTSFLDFLQQQDTVQAAGQSIERIKNVIADKLYMDLLKSDGAK